MCLSQSLPHLLLRFPPMTAGVLAMTELAVPGCTVVPVGQRFIVVNPRCQQRAPDSEEQIGGSLRSVQ